MIERFPYGKAPFWLMAIALVSTLLVVVAESGEARDKAELTFALFAPNHMPMYRRAIPEFERKHGVKVSLQLVHSRALQQRLQNSMLAKTEVPDLVEIQEGSIGVFARGPLEEVGLVDLTERLSKEGYRERIVESRFSPWSSRQHVFAVPHDVHPVMLMYRADLVEKLGIDVDSLTTWDAFVEAGRRVTRDLDGDGIADRYMIDLPTSGAWGLTLLLRQQGISYVDADGRVAFDQPKTVDTLFWYIHQVFGPQRIAWECGWGQTLVKAMTDGLALFYIAPDWRTFVLAFDAPNLAGKLKLMPLPAWEPGGRRTSVWGGSGLAIPKGSPKQELAWEFAKHLYFNPKELGRRFLESNIIPPFKDAWDLPEFRTKNAYFSGQELGTMYAALAKETPPAWTSGYSQQAEGKVSEAYLRGVAHFKTKGDAGLRELLQREVAAAAVYVNRSMARNVWARN